MTKKNTNNDDLLALIIKGIEDDVDIGSSSSSNQQVDQPKAPQKMAASTPKFEDISSPSESSPKI